MKTILEDCLQVCICTNCTIYQLTVSSHKIVNSCKQSEMRSQILNCKQKLKSTRKQIQWRDQSCVLSAPPPPRTTQLSSTHIRQIVTLGPSPQSGPMCTTHTAAAPSNCLDTWPSSSRGQAPACWRSAQPPCPGFLWGEDKIRLTIESCRPPPATHRTIGDGDNS